MESSCSDQLLCNTSAPQVISAGMTRFVISQGDRQYWVTKKSVASASGRENAQSREATVDGFASCRDPDLAHQKSPRRDATSSEQSQEGLTGNHDVFISHRGPDSKKTFVGYLHNAFHQVGLRCFLDSLNLHEGSHAWECIDQAIRNAPVCVAVFTKDYAASSWCLKELHAMLQNPDTTVFPVFYNVKPSDVGFPDKGLLKEGFEKLKSRKDDGLVQQWREDLETASKIMGLEYSDREKRLEVSFVNEVVTKVVDIVNKKLRLHVAEYPIGLEKHTDRIAKFLHSDDKRIKMLGIWGMGGIGKTTLAMDIYNQNRHKFSKACYLGNVREKAQLPSGLVNSQSQLLRELCGVKDAIDNVAHGKAILTDRLSRMKVLVVLDDVHDSEWLKSLISEGILGEGSRGIVTSRDVRVFKEAGFHDIYEMECLCGEDAEKLFRLHAFDGSGGNIGKTEKLVQEIVRGCGGLPLMLQICGAHLRQETSIRVWKEVLKGLEMGRLLGERRFFECLRISYDALETEHQQMFLDIACGLIGFSIEKVERVWEEKGWFVKTGRRNLIAKALMKLDDRNCIVMHSLLRDMGREIVQSENECPSKRSRLWMPDSLTALKNTNVAMENVQIINLFGYGRSVTEVLDLSLAMENVQIISLFGYGRNITEVLDLSHMRNLRILVQDEYVQIAALPPNLRMLRCLGVNSKPLKAKEVIGGLPEVNHLKVLDLLKMHINSFPSKNISNKLSNVREVDLSRTCVKEIGESISRLKQLNVLILSHCPIRTLPNSLSKLSELSKLLLDNTLLRNLPSCIYKLKKLKLLDLSHCTLLESAVESSLEELKELTELRLWGCGKLKLLRRSFGKLVKLQELDLSSCHSLETVPESIGGLRELSSISWSYCSKLTKLPNSLGCLIKLKKLYLTECSALKELPESLGNLISLSKLILSNCANLIFLPDSLGQLKKLQELDLTGCWALEALPESAAELTSLSILNLQNCENLRSLPNLLGQLTKLEVLVLSMCKNLEELPESLGMIVGLLKIGLEKCEKLTMLPASFPNLRMLDHLDLSYCSELQTLPCSLGGLESLSTLKLYNTTSLVNLPESLGEFPKLLTFDLFNCPRLTNLPTSFGNLNSLRALDIQDCSSVKLLPESLGNLAGLLSFHLGWCYGLSRLPESLGQLQALEKLCIEDCSALETLPHSLGQLRALQILQLSTCPNIRSLPESLGELKSLQILSLKNCASLQTLPQSIGELSSLSEFYLDSCSKLRKLPWSLGDLKKLEKLDLSKCFSLHDLPVELGELTKLTELRLATCTSLEWLPDSVGHLKRLQELDLLHCLALRELPASMKDLPSLSKLRTCGCLKPALSFVSFHNLTHAVTVDLDLWANPYCQAYQSRDAIHRCEDSSSRACSLDEDKPISETNRVRPLANCWSDLRCDSTTSSVEEYE